MSDKNEEKFEIKWTAEMKFQAENFTLQPAQEEGDKPEFHSVGNEETIYDDWDLSDMEAK